MNREVRIVPEAESNLVLVEAYLYISQDSPERAMRWKSGIEASINSLEKYPNRHAVVFDSEQTGREVRQMLFGVYPIYYSVSEIAVNILAVRHGSRLPLQTNELPSDP